MALDKVSKSLVKVFGSRSERLIKNVYMPIALRAGEFEEQAKKFDNETLKSKTAEFRAALITWRDRNMITSDIIGNASYIAAALALPAVRRSLQKGHLSQALKDLKGLSTAVGRQRPSNVLMQQAWAVMNVCGELLHSPPGMPSIATLIRERAADLADYLHTTDVAASITYYRKKIAVQIRQPIRAEQITAPHITPEERNRLLLIQKCAQVLEDLTGTVIKDQPSEQVEDILNRHARDIAHKLTDQDVHLLLDPLALEADNIMVEAFALVREVARRTIGMRHFDVQIIGGRVLSEGKIAEMGTGEGKTLVATLAAYILYLKGRKVHIVTVNDYLANRDAEWMAPIYNTLGMTVGVIQADMNPSGEDRKSQYACDVVYGTNNEFGFDYLRDNMKAYLEQMVQGELQCAIIDEVDSILIDEARTPLIISGPTDDTVKRYEEADRVARKLIGLQSDYNRIQKKVEAAKWAIASAQGELADAKKEKDNKRMEQAQKAIEKSQAELETTEAQLADAKQYYEVEEDKKAVHLTDEGVPAAQDIAGLGSFYTGSNMDWPHLISQSLRAHVTFEREKDYVVMDGKVIIVDEFTGRLMHGRQWSDGLHQAVEAKEHVTIKEESQTLGTITLQNFFKLYENIAGMTGTAATESEEFMNIYKMEVVVIPPNKPLIRNDRDDVIYKSMKEKFDAIVDEIDKTSATGRPVLVGTTSVEKNIELVFTIAEKLLGLKTKLDSTDYAKREKELEKLMPLLRERLNLEVLNAKNHAREALIIEKAGHQHEGYDSQMRGNITITTNMAGRGTDIKLGPGVADIGGLHVVGTERHESRRIDNQLRGRCGRQGDAGSSQFFLSFDDDLMRIFAPEWTVKALSWIGWEEGQPIYHKRISKGIEKAQKKVEERNFETRKSLVEYDEVMDYQRKIFYDRRREILSGKIVKHIIEETFHSAITKQCKKVLRDRYALDEIIEWTSENFDVDLKLSEVAEVSPQEIETIVKERAKDNIASSISLSLGEYLEDYSDTKTWDIDGLSKWASSTFHVNLGVGKIKDLSPNEIEEKLITASAEQIDKKDCTPLVEFKTPDFPLRRLAEWVQGKLNAQLDIEKIRGLKAEEVREILIREFDWNYREREIQYPIEYALTWISDPEDRNVYRFESLALWANSKYRAGLSSDQIEKIEKSQLREQLLALSREYHDGKLEEEVREVVSKLNPAKRVKWARDRFGAVLWEDQFNDVEESVRLLTKVGFEFLRRELTNLERDALRFVHDSAWKDHLYEMDRLKSSIWMRSWAEKDPKTEYKREAPRLFEQMFERIEDQITNIILKVERPEKDEEAQDLYTIGEAAHEQVRQFAAAQYDLAEYEQRQFADAQYERAVRQASRGEVKVKQIKLEQPKVGRNDPCPCKSGKKYKKCCGKNL